MVTITLLTDFGARGIYVGVMKGVIAARCPEARVIDLTHEVLPQAVREGAFLLESAYRFFDAATIHLAVVDPGVGTARQAIALAVPGIGRFISPDNGLFTSILLAHPTTEARLIANPAFSSARQGRAISATFHGRDLFASAAAALAAGAPFEALGPRLDAAALIRLPDFWARRESARRVRGDVVHIDRFGNLITNIRREVLAELPLADQQPIQITVGYHRCRGLARTYGERAEGEIIALFGSGETLEVARVNGRADLNAGQPPIGLGEPVIVTIDPAPIGTEDAIEVSRGELPGHAATTIIETL